MAKCCSELYGVVVDSLFVRFYGKCERDKRIYGLINREKLLIKANAWHWKWRWRIRWRRFHIASEVKRNQIFRINSVNERQDFFMIHVQWMNSVHRGVNTSKTYTATITLTLAHGITFYILISIPLKLTCFSYQR